VYRCIVDPPAVLSVMDGKGNSYPMVLSKAVDNLPADHPAVVQAPWAFEPMEPPAPRRGRPPKVAD